MTTSIALKYFRYLNILLLIAIVLLSLYACTAGKESLFQYQIEKGEDQQHIAEAYRIMKEEYLWSRRLPEISPSQYRSLEELFDSIIYKKSDKWSLVVKESDFKEMAGNKRYYGTGFKVKRDSNGEFRIAFVYKGSPAEIKGMKRGDRLVKINDTIFSEINSYKQWKEGEEDKIWDSGVDDSTYTLTYEDSSGSMSEVTMSKTWIDLTSNNQKHIFHFHGQKIGYLYYHTFLDLSLEEIGSMFSSFKSEKIDELIIDLRYNTGGYLLSAETVASLIVGKTGREELFIRAINNRSEEYASYYIEEMEASLSLERVFFIISESSCSAGEALIYGLLPYIDVILIGSTTCGKPFGFNTFHVGDKLLLPITVYLENARNEGDYTEGIEPVCFADDDVSKEVGSFEEASLREALHFIKHHECSSEGSPGHEHLNNRMSREITYQGLDRIIKAF